MDIPSRNPERMYAYWEEQLWAPSTPSSLLCMAGYISEYDELIAKKVAYVICGGDLSQPTNVSEQYLLDLEREAFLSLLGERKHSNACNIF